MVSITNILIQITEGNLKKKLKEANRNMTNHTPIQTRSHRETPTDKKKRKKKGKTSSCQH